MTSPFIPHLRQECRATLYLPSAIAQFEEALEKLPDNPTIRFHLGMAYYKKGENEKAIAELNKALDLNPDFPENKKAQEVIELLGN